MATTKDILLGNVSREADAPTERPQPAATKPESPTPPVESAPKTAAPQPPRMTYEELYNKLYGEQEEEAKKQEERLKRQKRISAIGDGIAALANLFFATKGAPNMFDANNSASSRARVRYDNFMKQRNADRKLYINGLMRARQADDAKAESDRQWQRQLGLDQEARDRYKAVQEANRAKETRDKELHDLNVKYHQGKVNEQEYKAKKAKVEADYAARVKESEIAKNNAAAAASGRSNRLEYRAWDKNGEVHYFKDKEAADQFAVQHGTYSEASRSKTTVKTGEHGKQEITKEEVPAGFPRIVEKKKPNPMGGSNAKKDNPMN